MFGSTRTTPVGADLRDKLGLAGIADGFQVGEGAGTLRILIAQLRPQDPPRETLAAIARRLSASVPHLLWLVLSTDGNSHVGISVWCLDGNRIRVCALITDPQHIAESDSQTMCAMVAGVSASDSLTHLRWTEILGREALTIKFFRALRRVVEELSISLTPAVPRPDADELSLVYVSRLLFLSFVETKGWLNGDHDFLSNTFIQCMTSGGSYHKKVLTPLFFGTLNTPEGRRAPRARAFGRVPFLNGGLFGRTRLEQRRAFEFTDDAIGQVFGDLLTRFRFSGLEQSVDLTDSAIDPEILGRAFESLMQRESRKSSGAYYTPHALVQRVSDCAVEAWINTHGGGSLDRIRVIDPACGSGAFLVYLLEKLADLRGQHGDSRSISDRRRDVLAKSIFGVDINPTAVWLCELRLWLSVVIHTEGATIVPLPNLDRNIRVGDSLGAQRATRPGFTRSREIERTRVRYVHSVGTRKKLLVRRLERLERRSAIVSIEMELDSIAEERKDLITAIRSPNLFGERQASAQHSASLKLLRTRKAEVRLIAETIKNGGALPFAFETHFGDVFENGGFDIVIGNPPWVRLHQIAKTTRASLRNHFEIFKMGGWSIGAERAAAGRGFAHQIDLSALFVERSIAISRDGGRIALLLPAKLWKSLAGGSVRALVRRTCAMELLEDFSGARAMFDATTYPSLLVARKEQASTAPGYSALNAVVHRREEVLHWKMSSDMLPLEQSPGSPWMLLPGEVRSGFDKIASRGIPLAESALGRPILGVKTGLNEAFIVTSRDVEAELLRPVIKGESIEAWKLNAADEKIIWTHGERGEPLQNLPPLAACWLERWKKPLLQRADARRDKQWWKLFRTEAADSSTHRVVWSDIGRSPRAAVIAAGNPAVPLNTCYVVRCKSEVDSQALATLLNSPLIAAWLSLIAEPAQGGYNRYLGWTMAMMPVPRDWNKHRRSLADIYARSAAGDPPDPHDLFLKSLKVFGLSPDDVHDMMAWTHK